MDKIDITKDNVKFAALFDIANDEKVSNDVADEAISQIVGMIWERLGTMLSVLIEISEKLDAGQ